MGGVLLWSFQPATRVVELHVTGRLVGWNDYLYDLSNGLDAVPRWDVPTLIADDLVQVCLPMLPAERVREVRPLPRSPDEVTNWSARA